MRARGVLIHVGCESGPVLFAAVCDSDDITHAGHLLGAQPGDIHAIRTLRTRRRRESNNMTLHHFQACNGGRQGLVHVSELDVVTVTEARADPDGKRGSGQVYEGISVGGKHLISARPCSD